jgi:hypothetical protein
VDKGPKDTVTEEDEEDATPVADEEDGKKAAVPISRGRGR